MTWGRVLLALWAFTATAVPFRCTAATLQLTDASLADLQSAMRSGDTSSVELTVLHLNRIMAYDRRGPKLNAVPVLNPRALEEAARADALRRLGIELSPLQGIPFVVKDSFNVAGLPTSAGVAAWRHLSPIDDAYLVARMRQAGAVLLGKTNLDTFASNSEGISEAFGAVRNPYGASAVGGSSAGSAVAVAAHLAVVAFGGDTAGSLRMPASRNGVVSIRPTLGLISTAGTVPGDPLFDVVGPLTRTVDDLARVLDVVVAPDPHNPLASYLPLPEQQRPKSFLLESTPRALRGTTLAVPRRLVSAKSDGARFLTPGKPILEAFALIRQKLLRGGAQIRDVDVPVDQVLDDTWYYDRDVSQADAIAKPIYDARVALVNIRAFAGEFEKFCKGWCGDPADRMLDVAALFDYPEFMEAFQVLRAGTTLSLNSAPVAASIRNAAQIAQGPLFAQWMAREKFDALLFPASSDADSDTRFGLNYLSELGVPGLFIPAGYVAGGAAGTVQPLGVALVGTQFHERQLLEVAAAVEAHLQARVNPASAPALEDETIALSQSNQPGQGKRADLQPPQVSIEAIDWYGAGRLSGLVSDASGISELRVYVNGAKTQVAREGTHWQARLAADVAQETLCVPEGLIIAFAKDASGNAAAAWKPLSPPSGCASR